MSLKSFRNIWLIINRWKSPDKIYSMITFSKTIIFHIFSNYSLIIHLRIGKKKCISPIITKTFYIFWISRIYFENLFVLHWYSKFQIITYIFVFDRLEKKILLVLFIWLNIKPFLRVILIFYSNNVTQF